MRMYLYSILFVNMFGYRVGNIIFFIALVVSHIAETCYIEITAYQENLFDKILYNGLMN